MNYGQTLSECQFSTEKQTATTQQLELKNSQRFELHPEKVHFPESDIFLSVHLIGHKSMRKKRLSLRLCPIYFIPWVKMLNTEHKAKK